MAEITREIVHNKGSSFVSWLALILAALALLVAWLAYNRSGEDLENRIQRQVNQAINETQQESREAQNEPQEETRENTNQQPANNRQ